MSAPFRRQPDPEPLPEVLEPQAPQPWMPQTDVERAYARINERRLRRLGDAIARGLRKYSPSPMLECDHYWSLTWSSRTWDEERTLAETELAKRPVLAGD